MDRLEQYLQKMRSVLHRRGHKQQDIEDLIQDAYVRMLEYCEKGAQVRQPEALLVTTAQRLAINHHRDQHQDLYSSKPLETHALVDPSPNPEEELHLQQCLDKATKTLDAISRRTREVFLMQRLEGLSYAQISAQTGMSISTIEKHIARAVTVLIEQRRRDIEDNGHG